MNTFLDTIMNNVDWVIVIIVLCSGFFQNRYLAGFSWRQNAAHDSALKTLFVSFVASLLYILLIKNPENGKNWAMYFLSYFFATSLYELLVKPFVSWIQSKT